MASLLKSFVIAAGAGIAVGLCATTSSRRAPRRERERAEDGLLRIEPLLDRLERVEGRLATAEAPSGGPVDQGELSRRLNEQQAELQALRLTVEETERQAAAAVRAVESRLREVEQGVPALVESRVASEAQDLERRVESQLELRISERIGAIERTLAEQSASIGALRDRAVETDANLKRLITAIERLCERTPPPSESLLPFEAQMAEAVKRGESGESRVRVVQPKEPEVRKSRSPFARIFGFALAVGISRFLR